MFDGDVHLRIVERVVVKIDNGGRKGHHEVDVEIGKRNTGSIARHFVITAAVLTRHRPASQLLNMAGEELRRRIGKMTGQHIHVALVPVFQFGRRHMFEVSHSIRPEKRSFGHFTDVGDEKFAVLRSEFTGILNILAGYFAAVLVDEVFVYDSYRFIDQIIDVGKSQSKIKIWSLLERETDSSVTGI